jgi:hypothetical protein
MKQPIKARGVAGYSPILTSDTKTAIGSAAHLTRILDSIERSLGFSPPIRAGALSLLEWEHNLHPGEVWDIAALAWGAGK